MTVGILKRRNTTLSTVATAIAKMRMGRKLCIEWRL